MNATPCPICQRPPTIKTLPSQNVELYHKCESFYIELHGNGERDNYVKIWNNLIESLRKPKP
jgi:hypothetical protein